jgi:hypothetical protein
MEKTLVFNIKKDGSFTESIGNMLTAVNDFLKTSGTQMTTQMMQQIQEIEGIMKKEKEEEKKPRDMTETKAVYQSLQQNEVELSLLGFTPKTLQKLKSKGFTKTTNVLELVDKIYYEYPYEMEDVVIELLKLIEVIHPEAFRKYVQSIDETGDNLLMDSAIVKVENLALYLLSKDKVDLNQQNQHGYTFLMYVCKNGWNPIFDRILPYVDIMIKNEHQETALHYAVESKNEYMCEKLLKKMKDEDLFELSSHQNNALLTVARGSFEDLCIELMRRAPLLIYQMNKQNDTILHIASRYELKRVLQEIFQNHFESFDMDFVNIRNTNGYTAVDLMLIKKLKKEYSFMIHSGKLNESIYEIYSSTKTKTYDQSFMGIMILNKKEESLVERCLKTISYKKSDRINWLHYFCMYTLSYSMRSYFALFFDELKDSFDDVSLRIHSMTKTLLMVLIEVEWYEFVDIILSIENIDKYVSTLSHKDHSILTTEIAKTSLLEEEKKTALYIACEKVKKNKTVIEKLLMKTNLSFYQDFDGIEHLQKCKKMILHLNDKHVNQLFDEKIKELRKEKMVLVSSKESTSKYLFQEFSDSDFEQREVNRRCSFIPLTFEL